MPKREKCGVEKDRVLVGRMLRRCVAMFRAATQKLGGTLM
jgi:hypothetical protein